MKTTIDKAGRVVIPAAIREKADLRPGTEVEVILDDLSVRLVRTAPRPKLAKRGRRLVARPTAKQRPSVDVAALVEAERNRWPW